MNKQLKIAICDDEKNALSIISASVKNMLEERGVTVDIHTISSAKELWGKLQTESYDLLFLDINMPKIDGIALGKKIINMPDAPDIIFVSSKTDRVFETFEIRPFGFIRKDNFVKDISSVVNRYIQQRVLNSGKSSVLGVKDGNVFLMLNVDNIEYIECQRNIQILYFVAGDKKEIHSRLEILETQLGEYGFIRVHKGYLVNCRYIKRFAASTVVLHSGMFIPVGRSKKNEAMQKWMAYIRIHGISFIG